MTTIAVAGLGYVGLSVACLLARHHTVIGVDLDEQRVQQLQQGQSPIQDTDISRFLAEEELDLTFTTDGAAAYAAADTVVIATPTDYDPETDSFDTSSVEAVIAAVRASGSGALMVIKSTIPVGFVASLGADDVIFSPEFLREGRALWDNLHPSRIVVGEQSERARDFADLLVKGAETDGIPVVLTGPTEAEAIKLFANTYLAMRVAFFNELDSFAMARDLDPRDVIEGVGLDPRIGTHYNNPSFGYGGYCLPKDTRQLLANYADVPQDLIHAVVAANTTRKDVIAADIVARRPRVVGIYRLIMKAGSDNFRESSVQGIMQRIQAAGIDVIVHEPELDEPSLFGAPLVPDFDDFVRRADLVVANRRHAELEALGERVYTRDLFGGD